MQEKNYVQLSRSFWISTIVLIIWISFLPGVRSLIKGFYDWTTFFLLGFGIFVPMAAIGSNFLKRLEKRKFEKFRVLVTTGLFIALGGIYLYKLLSPRNSIAADPTFWRFHSLGVLLLIGLALLSLVKVLLVPLNAEEL